MADTDGEPEVAANIETHHEETPPAPPVHNEGGQELHSRVNGLSTKVEELTTMVQDLLNKGEQDTTPVHRPWTHAGGRR